MRLLLAVLAVGCMPLLACTPAQPVPAPPADVPAVKLSESQDAPMTLTYDRLDADRVPLAPTGLDADGVVKVPPVTDPSVVYVDWSAEMTNRPLVATAHVNTRDLSGAAVPGVFANLKTAEVGDQIEVAERDGDIRTYRVTDVDSAPKDAFPVSVYDPGDRLVLVTCTGDIEVGADGRRSFDANEIVAAERVS
ncbi:class F sortase [Pseudonocardia alni]|uniref:class F sortase n=1 Tax=Pseudonocardia alni TaxID=33907 RepID=UPI00332715AD